MLGHVNLNSFVSHRLNDPTLLQLKISSEEKRYSNNFVFKSVKVSLVYNSIFPVKSERTVLFCSEHFNIFFFYSHL